MAGEAIQREAYSPAEFAKLAGVAESTVIRHMDEGWIPELQPLGGPGPRRRRFIPARFVRDWTATVINQSTNPDPLHRHGTPGGPTREEAPE